MCDAGKGGGTFIDRKEWQMRKVYGMELDGYSNFIVDKINQGMLDDFTITCSCTPYTYETNSSGIFSAFSMDERKGIAISIRKSGIVEVKIGLGGLLVEIFSLKEHLRFQKNNLITVAFWGTAGWCDLYVNGVLSNRKQFPRHSKICIPAGKYYVGKYVDGKETFEDSKYGVFHGKLNFIEFTKKYLPYSKVISFHRQQEEKGSEAIDLYKTQNFEEDIYRPVYHLIPPGKWMNEPHAPFYYRGYYHIFYQANPHAPVWDNLCWGHLVSEDMLSWKDAGIALYPDTEGLDMDGCWSGSACMDAEGNPILFYTAGNNKELPNQSIAVAYPENKEDLELKCWIKQGVVLRQTPENGFLGEFRDPFVWRKEDTYYILVGTGDSENGGGNALIYTSTDLENFTCHGFVTDYQYEKCEEAGHVWELPVLLPLRNEKGEYCCDILLFCACQIEKEAVETYYFLGKFDYEQNKFHRFHELPRLFDLGYGTFTGPSGFVTPDERSVVFTIAQGKRKPEDEYRSGWAHNGGMPIELSIKNNVLQTAPVSELQKYFSECIHSQKISEENCGRKILQKENLLENCIRLSGEGSSLELILEWEEDSYMISYDRNTREWKTISGKTGERISKLRGEEDLVDIGDEPIEMVCYVDHSLIEVYLNDRKGMTLRSYPFCEKNRCFVKTDGVCSVSIWNYKKLAD